MADVTWDLLDPGTDLTAEAIRNLFPVSSGSSEIGGAATVLSGMIGVASGIACAAMIGLAVYALITKTVQAGETGEIRDGNTSWWTLLRITFAAFLLIPFSSGFNAGQALVTQVALAGVGLASHLAKSAVEQVGPASQTIVTPLIPGTKRTVSALMQNELCRALVNVASGNSNLIPAPSPVSGNSTGGAGYATWSYGLGGGNATGGPVCGSVTVRTQSGATQSGSVADVSSAQSDAVQSVLTSSIRPAATQIAQQLWRTRSASSLNSMMSTLVSASAAYTARLQTMATTITESLRSQFTADQMRQGDMGTPSGMLQMSQSGFFGLGAYYMRLSRLNGFTLSLISAMPEVTGPSYQGLGYYLSSDLAPMIQAVREFQAQVDAYVATSDPLDAPTGGAELFAGAAPASTGAGVIETVLRKMDFSESLLQLFVRNLAPAQASWQDPFTALMRLGNDMASLALMALGGAALLSSTTASTGIAAFNVLTFNWGGAAATMAGSMAMQFLATPVFYLLLFLLVPGLTLAFVVPMIPMVMWTMGILGFLIRLFEAIIAVPLWMLAHVTIGGDGLHGRGTRGWGHVASLFLTPSLMVLGLFGAYWAFTFVSRLIFLTFTVAAGFTLTQGWLVANVAGLLVLLSMFTLLHILAEVQCFRLITLMAVHVPSWMGIENGDRMDSHAVTQEATMVGMGATLAAIRAGGLQISSTNQSSGRSTRDGSFAWRTRDGMLSTGTRSIGMDRTVAAATDPGPGTDDRKES